MRRFVTDLPPNLVVQLKGLLDDHAEDLGQGVVAISQRGFEYLVDRLPFDIFTVLSVSTGGHEIRANSVGYVICEDRHLAAPDAAYLSRRGEIKPPPDGYNGKSPWWWESTIRAWMAGDQQR